MEPSRSNYHSYLLRLWWVREDGDNWRASLEDVQTSELHGFSKLEDLIDYLEALTRFEDQQTAVPTYQAESRR